MTLIKAIHLGQRKPGEKQEAYQEVPIVPGVQGRRQKNLWPTAEPMS
jgi:hypothetical protein